MPQCPPAVRPPYPLLGTEAKVVDYDAWVTRIKKHPNCGRLSRSVTNSDGYWRSACDGLRCHFLRHLTREMLFPHLLRIVHKAHLYASDRPDEEDAAPSTVGGSGGTMWRAAGRRQQHVVGHAEAAIEPRLYAPTNQTASVEVGVWMGRFSQYLLRELVARRTDGATCRRRLHRHYMVDPYLHYSCARGAAKDKQCLTNQSEFDSIYARVGRDLDAAPHALGQCAVQMRRPSVAAARQLAITATRAGANGAALPSSTLPVAPAPLLSFAYIDARHDYEGVFADLGAWWPHVRRGGVVGGHDVTAPGVAHAVRDFLKARGPAQAERPVFVTKDHPASWVTVVA